MVTEEYARISGKRRNAGSEKGVKEAIPLYYTEIGTENIACLVRFIDA